MTEEQNQFDFALKVIAPVDDLLEEHWMADIELEDNQRREW